MTEPQTPTGKRLWRDGPWHDSILAIEAEAARQERERLLLEVNLLDTDEFIDSYEAGTIWEAIDKRDIVRLLAEPEETP